MTAASAMVTTPADFSRTCDSRLLFFQAQSIPLFPRPEAPSSPTPLSGDVQGTYPRYVCVCGHAGGGGVCVSAREGGG
eukprot:3896668-Pleurochrysis_carterae.AAC.1